MTRAAAVLLVLAGCAAGTMRRDTIARKSLDAPDDTRTFEKGRVQSVTIDRIVIERATLEPWWKWSTCVRPTVGTELCSRWHATFAVSGRLHVKMKDGTEADIDAGDFALIPPEHDAWTVGDRPVVLVELRSADFPRRPTKLQKKSVRWPDKTRVFDRGKVAEVTIEGITLEQGVLEPGWRWSVCNKPIAKTEQCEKRHVKYVVSGFQKLTLGGSEWQIGPGDFAIIPPGHDAWTVGQSPTVVIEFPGAR